MKNSVVLSAIFLAACNKDSTKPTNPPQPPPSDNTLGTMNIHLSCDGRTVGNIFELIISEPGGKILLDSVAPVLTPIIATLKTNVKLVNLTCILPGDTSQNFPHYFLAIYKDIDPSNWVSFTPGLTGNVICPTLSGAPGNFFFENYPSLAS